MNRHPFRWENLTFGLFFLACVGSWAVWSEDLLTPRELSLTAAAVLIVVGVIGFAASLRQARPAPADDPTTQTKTPTHTQDPIDEGTPDEAADPYP